MPYQDYAVRRFIITYMVIQMSTFISSVQLVHGLITNSHNNQFPVGWIAQLVEHCTGIPGAMGSNLVLSQKSGFHFATD